MNMPLSNYSPNSEKFQKHPNSSNLISFWAFLVSIFIYISVFYVFHLSPSTLLSNPKFWFIISNTLIIIIAVDFSASENHPDYLYDTGENIDIASSFEIRYEKLKAPKHCKKEGYEEAAAHESIIGMVDEKKEIISDLDGEVIEIVADLHVMKKEANDRVVRKSNKMLGEKAVMLSEKYKYDNAKEEEARLEENNEFSRMSDEEVNQRVEEFIKRFKRQIRLQANTS